MGREEFQAWRERWKSASRKIAELQTLDSPEVRLGQLEAARLTALSLGWDKDRCTEDEIARERWRRIRQRWLEKHGPDTTSR